MSELTAVLKKHQSSFHPVVPLPETNEGIVAIDLSEDNDLLTETTINDLEKFTQLIAAVQLQHHATYLIGGYNENRNLYSRSTIFDGSAPRRLHLGLDIWAKAGTPVFAFMGGMVHSFAFNDQLGDYGATLVLLHQLDGIPFHTLYGHISLSDITNISEGQYVSRGQTIAHIGEPHENGYWPPHLHFQIISDMGLWKGDYPGVCANTDAASFLNNCPDPDLIAMMNRFCNPA